MSEKLVVLHHGAGYRDMEPSDCKSSSPQKHLLANSRVHRVRFCTILWSRTRGIFRAQNYRNHRVTNALYPNQQKEHYRSQVHGHLSRIWVPKLLMTHRPLQNNRRMNPRLPGRRNEEVASSRASSQFRRQAHVPAPAQTRQVVAPT